MIDPSLALATRGLRKSYGSRLALDGLDLSVPAGVVYGFLGPTARVRPRPCAC
jgi:ABC-2 type transport system ATP-binding protein